MNIRNLVSRIQRNIDASDIEDVNNGGCAYFAFYAANELDKRNIPYKIKVIDRVMLEGSSISKKKQQIYRFLNEGILANPEKISFQHCFIQVKSQGITFEFDAERTSEEPGWMYGSADYIGYFSKQDLKVSIRYGRWSKRYRKSKNKELRDIIRKSF